MRRIFLTVAVIVLVISLPLSAQRVPAVVTPSHYDLAFVVDLTRERFSGTETIKVQVNEPTSKVVLNAVDLELQQVTIGSGEGAQPATVTLDQTSQTATLTVPKPLAKGATEIHTKFTGVLNNQLRGFYVSKTK